MLLLQHLLNITRMTASAGFGESSELQTHAGASEPYGPVIQARDLRQISSASATSR